jgi:predicted XRE-type DNA-binding protein
MTKENLKELLKQAELNKKELSEILGIAQQTVNCWGTTQNMPYWLESWLKNYIKAKDMDKVVEAVKPHIK